MRVLYSAVYWTAFFLDTVFWSFVVIATVLVTWPFDRRLRLAQYGATYWAASGFRLNPRWSVETRGREKLDRAASVICANHQSKVDILALSTLHGNWRWVSKREVFWIPFLGWAMKAVGTPFVKRGDKESGQKMLAHCRRWLERGVSILIFPEGTRSPDGELQAFKPGAFKLALESGRPVVPLVVVGASEALPKKGADMSRRAHVVVSVLEAIDVTPWQASFDVEGLSGHVRGLMGEELRRLRDERTKTAAAA